ncbi:MAG: ABC transporter permease, partial [Verrucomicrobia bacterium]|nr:ABC transporter permease [Cytophagales bacterium]
MSVAKKKIHHKTRLGSYPIFSVVFSLTLALFVIGLCGLLILQGRALLNQVRENIEMYVYLDNFQNNNQLEIIEKQLFEKRYILVKNDSAQVRFVSKELAAQEFMAEAGEDFISFLGNNPLHDSFVIRLKPKYFSSDGTSDKLTNFKRVKEDLEKISGVFEVSYAAEQVDEIEKNLDKITWFLLGFTVVLFFSIAVLLN